MVKRRDLKATHESTVLRQFSVHLENLGNHVRLLSRPDPPEAIVSINQETTWIEITDAFLDTSHAIGLTTGTCEDMEHITDSGRLVIEPDAGFSEILNSVIDKKFEKNSMYRILDKYGPGILLVDIFTSFASAEEIAHNEAKKITNLALKKPIRLFNTIYAYDGSG